ncbi:hypothetical protein [Bacillus infantis]|uniref:hypothetical protein n=1 Tax=Bacillus infantis TaxID=324767 RepID=UPI0020A1A325|nr:hypothetical protein [Bacillus infantis]MCP1159311.1 hypothetical protein [Bacillus infantis]
MFKKKNFKRNAVTVSLIAGVFVAGGAVGANTDWQSTLKLDATKQIGGAAAKKRDELLSGTDEDINDIMKDSLQVEVDQQKAELERLLEEYYQMKLNGLADSPEYKALEQEIAKIKEGVLTRYKADIDAAFEGK